MSYTMFTVNKYHKMSNAELEKTAGKWNIQYGLSDGATDRNLIIEKLIQRDKANNSRIAIFISIIALIVSIIGLIINAE